jgi:hypothetical protein
MFSNLTKPRPFTSTLNVKPKKQELQKSLSADVEIENDDPWEPKSSTLNVPKNPNRTHSTGEEDIESEGLLCLGDFLLISNLDVGLEFDLFNLG